MKHFLKETDFAPQEVAEVFALARTLKRTRGRNKPALAGQTWALIFAKASTRTRVSFEVGIHELGGHALFLNKNDLQLGRSESIADTARVLSRFVHGLVVRTYAQSDVEELARHGSIPVINALTDLLHPCQLYTDAFTAAERWAGPRGDLMASLRGRKIAFLGDTRFNMANSWILGAALFGMEIVLAGPGGYKPGAAVAALLRAGGYADAYRFTTDPGRGGHRRRHRLYGRLDEHGPGGGGKAAPGPDAPLRGYGQTVRKGETRRALHALPSGAPRRRGRAGGAR